MKNAMRWIGLAMVVLCGFTAQDAFAAPTSTSWDKAADSLAGQVAEILGPGEARLTVRNLSSIPSAQLPVIRGLLEADLKAHGVTVSGPDSANLIRVTLSESARERLWAAEVVEGNDTRVAMVDLGPIARTETDADGARITLRKQVILSSREPVLSAIEVSGGLITLEPEQIVRYARAADGWMIQNEVSIPSRKMLSLDPRGMLVSNPDGVGFSAWLPGTLCSGQLTGSISAGKSPVECSESEDPWPIVQSPIAPGITAQTNAPTSMGTSSIKAFYNASRNYFTGVVAPSMGVDLPPFYSAALISRLAGPNALLISGVDGKVQLAENGNLHPIAGARDWGSDFAVLRSGCGAGEQVIASGSGEAAQDSLRAYELPAFEAIPASDPLAVDGSVIALWPAPDQKSVFAVVRSSTKQYEVDRVTALCN